MAGIELAIMIEGQDGLTWPRWQRLARAAEDLGYAALYRSDHFTNPGGPHTDALDLWASLTWLASHTERIEFGQLVSPAAFYHPARFAWTAAAVADLSGGRLRLGLGAGWQEREHRSFGLDLMDVPGRFARLEEALQVVTLLLRSEEPVAFAGRFYHLEDALLLPRPARPGGPPIVIGGNGPRRTLPLAARYADEWNAVMVTPDRFRALSARLDELVEAAGRRPADVRRTVMTRVVIGRDEAEVRAKLGDRDADELRARGALLGTADQLVEGMGRLAEAGARRLMAQWLDQDDIAGLEEIAARVMPQVSRES
ncbi:MAG TPA: TIGR03560 family F420-dependent LLM class oxidoreductase [Methylomirabilota bacterium]|nr:TIGR03560 family F420-dependent LLM class oxidoreductase [Methylomirabilota bacterium]